ncbi:MAG: hypothetical protein COC01_05275 [Bacteroidetes bacterium]|nr:MAG: hypothetical protein COC01_05275 [Bacteroidota bacterium]
MVALKDKRHTVTILIKTKDIFEDLLKADDVNYLNILPEGRGNSKLEIIWGFLKRDFRMARNVIKNKLDLLIGSDPAITHIGKLFNILSLVFVEDDAHVIRDFAKLVFLFVSIIVAPVSCDLSK